MKFIGGGGGWALGAGGWEVEGGQYHPQLEANSSAVPSVGHTNCHSQPGIGPDGRQQQFDTPSSLISAHQWPHGLCSGRDRRGFIGSEKGRL